MPPELHALPTSQAHPWGQSRTYKTVLSKYKPWEPAGWGCRDCLRPLVSPPCHKVMSTCLQLLPLGREQGFSYCPRWRLGPVLYCSGILQNFSAYFWPWLVWGFELVTQDRTPARRLWAIWGRNCNPCTKTQICSQSNSKKIENYVIKGMTVFKHITFFVQMLFLNIFFSGKDIILKVWKPESKWVGTDLGNLRKLKSKAAMEKTEDSTQNLEKARELVTGISRLGDKSGVNNRGSWTSCLRST